MLRDEYALFPFQIELKDFEFSPILRDMCLEDIREHCQQSKTKYVVIWFVKLIFRTLSVSNQQN